MKYMFIKQNFWFGLGGGGGGGGGHILPVITLNYH